MSGSGMLASTRSAAGDGVESVTADAGAPSAPAGKLGVPDVPDVPAVPDGGALDGWPVAAGPTAIGAQPAIASSSDTVTATASS